MSFKTPVLFLIFNRPATTARVFEEIRKIRPAHLFVAADGPRANVQGEADQCNAARQLVLNIDWDCNVQTLFRDDNRGCGKGVSEAISWFFDHVEEGIILEDDCLPNTDFFTFCEAMLNRYRDQQQIMHIGGTNFQPNPINKNSYYFSKYFHIWGWATWRRSWQKYNFDIDISDEKRFTDIVHKNISDKYERNVWSNTFKQMSRHYIDTWDIQWVYSIFAATGIGITPMKNLVSNIGFGQDATHTTDANSTQAHLQRHTLHTLQHPKNIKVSKRADRYTYKLLFQHGNTRFNAIKFKLGLRLPFLKTIYLRLKAW